jgi:hypothetical protein
VKERCAARQIAAMRRSVRISRVDVLKAQAPQPWAVGNEAIYRLCRAHGEHVDRGVVASKVWLIGRSYAASIERHKNSDSDGENFILKKVAPRLVGWRLDGWFEAVPHRRWAFVNEAGLAVTIHARVLQRLQPLLRRSPRSFVSKYLHFHHPELFPIYDSRATAAIRLATPDPRQLDPILAATADDAYGEFCARLRWLLLDVRSRFGVRLSLREVDNLLLEVHRRASKA